MANQKLFTSNHDKPLPKTDAVNAAGGPAYALSAKHALAQYAATGCMNTTFYASAEEQLDQVIALSGRVAPEFVARAAIFARERGYMKDMPALLCAVLSVLAPELCTAVFPRVIDDGKMLRTFVQVLRSGAVARRSLGTRPKRLVQSWFEARDDAAIFRSSVGQSPSLADVVKMVHPKPASASRRALYGYLLGRAHDAAALPDIVRRYEDFKAKRTTEVPDVPFQMLTAFELGSEGWAAIARRASWQTTRMNLNTFARHGVFKLRGMTRQVAAKLRDPEAIAKARAFPYQLMAAYTMVNDDVPREIREALEEAMEVALKNVPRIDGKVFVLPDVSGSMSSPVTGHRAGATTAVRCIDVAALVAAAALRKNPSAEVVPFEHKVVESVRLSGRDSVMTNAEKLARIGGGGTSTSAPLAWLNAREAKGDLVIYISDNESWVDAQGRRATETMCQWGAFKERNPDARMVCIDIQPNATTQAKERHDVLNIGGFSDHVFDVIADFARGGFTPGRWVRAIEEIRI